MFADLSANPLVWALAILILVLCWPLAQALRHDKLRPVAAYLLFTSVLALVSAAVFAALVLAGTLLLPGSAMAGAGPAAAVALLALAAGGLAAYRIVRMPQSRRMPK